MTRKKKNRQTDRSRPRGNRDQEPTHGPLPDSEARLHAILTTAVDAIVVIDEAGTVESVNPAVADIFGYESEEVVGKNVSMLMPEPDRSQHNGYLTNYLRSGEPKIIGTGREVEGRRKDGTVVPIHLSVSKMSIAGRRLFTGIVRDISREREVTESLRRSDERFDLAMRGANDGVWDWPDVNDEKEWWSPRFFELLGYEPGEIVPSVTTFKSLLHPEDEDRTLDAVRACFESDRSPYDVEHRLQTKSGEYRWFRARACLLRDQDGRPRRMTGCIEDIHERQRAEGLLREETRQLQTLLDNLPGMAYRCVNDANWTMQSVSAGCKPVTGYDPKDLEDGRVVYADLIHPDDREDVWTAVQKAVAKREPFEIRYRIRAKDGREKWVWERGRSVLPEQAPDEVIEGFITDITPLKETEREASQLRENLAHVSRLGTMGEMAAGIAHEINQPLTAIGAYAAAARNLLKSGAADATELHDIIAKIQTGAHRAAEVIRRLRALVKKRPSERSLADANILVLDVVNLAENEARLANVRFEKSLTDSLPKVFVDVVQIQQVLLNLIRNGIEAVTTPARTNPVITVATAACEGDFIRISVADQGPGIPEKIGNQVFEQFYTTKPSGMGLGLAISRSLVVSHGGKCWCERNTDGGATFMFTLPIASEVFER
jgi:PAS domain S-box-containing protein